MNEKRVGVCLSAVVQRLNRKLKKEGQILRNVRGKLAAITPKPDSQASCFREATKRGIQI